MSFRILTPAEQVAAHLEAELLRGRWREQMPGVIKLSSEMGVNRATLQAGLKLLESRGMLEPGGEKRRRRILLPKSSQKTGSSKRLRVKILLHNEGDESSRDILQLMQHLHQTGHYTEFAGRSLWSLGMDVKRVARYIGKHPADAWVVLAGSREILQWFSSQPVRCFALFGGFRGVDIAGAKPDKIAAQREAVRRLYGLGHRRIVKVALMDRIHPVPGQMEQAFLDDLNALGIQTGAYNLAGWEDEPSDFYRRLDSLFRHSPPSALFLDAVSLFHAARDHLAKKGIVAPRDLSLVCDDPDTSFRWMQPSVAHIHWTFDPIARRIAQWLENVAAGKNDRRQTLLQSQFIDGMTIGAVTRA